MKQIRFLTLMLIAAMLLAAVGCGGGGNEVTPSEVTPTEENTNPIVTIEMEDGGQIKIELYPDKAPNTVANFVTLVQEGFYDGVVFHRLIPGFVIQGGDPTGTGTGGPGHRIKGEFSGNKFTQNDIAHVRGVISMARSQQMDSAGSQFFICTAKAANLDGLYAGFGMVMDEDSLKVVDGIVSQPTRGEIAINPPMMKKVTVETFGVEYEVAKLN